MNAPYLNDLHRAAGARLAGDPPRLLTYGDVPAEYRAAESDCALFDETDRGRIRVRGSDRVELLHRILANEVRALAPGSGDRNLLLSSKGKILADFELAVGDDEIELSTEPGTSATVLAEIDKYLFAEDVTLEDASESAAPLALAGPRAREIASAVVGPLGDLAEHAWRDLRHGERPVRVTALPIAGSPGIRLDAGPSGVEELWRALVEAGARPAGRVARDSLRCEAGRAQFGVDVDENVYPQEARLEDAFSLSKGCYIGQEVVAKIDTYGGLNKLLMALRVSHDDPVPRGARLMREANGEWRDVGVVTSWAYSFALDSGLVLAYVKRRHQDEGTTFRVDDGPGEATIVELPARAGAVPLPGA